VRRVHESRERVHVDLARAVAIESADGEEAGMLPGAAEHRRRRHVDASVGGHERVGVLERPRVRVVVLRAELHEVGDAAGPGAAIAIDDGPVRGHLHQRLRPRALRRATERHEPIQVGALGVAQHGLHVGRDLGKADDCRWLERHLGLVDERAHGARPDQREPVERAERGRRVARLRRAPIDEQATPAVGQAVLEEPGQPVPERGVAHRDARPERRRPTWMRWPSSGS